MHLENMKRDMRMVEDIGGHGRSAEKVNNLVKEVWKQT